MARGPTTTVRRCSTGVLALTALLTSGCGYQLVQTQAPFGAARIRVEPFAESVPLGLTADLTRALAERLADGGVRVTSDLDAAVLRGEIASAHSAVSPTSAGLGSRVTAYRLTITITATLAGADGESLWTGSTRLFEDFLPGDAAETGDLETLATEANRRRALRRLAEQAAEDLHAQLVMKSHLRGGGDAKR